MLHGMIQDAALLEGVQIVDRAAISNVKVGILGCIEPVHGSRFKSVPIDM